MPVTLGNDEKKKMVYTILIHLEHLFQTVFYFYFILFCNCFIMSTYYGLSPQMCLFDRTSAALFNINMYYCPPTVLKIPVFKVIITIYLLKCYKSTTCAHQ